MSLHHDPQRDDEREGYFSPDDYPDWYHDETYRALEGNKESRPQGDPDPHQGLNPHTMGQGSSAQHQDRPGIAPSCQGVDDDDMTTYDPTVQSRVPGDELDDE